MLKSIFRQGQTHDREATDAATKLLQTLADSFSVEDRRQAASDLRDVLLDNPNAKSTISSFGLETVCSTIRSDWNNGQVVRNCLESLAIVVDTSYSKNFAESRVNAEQLARTPGALGLLFDSLEYSQDSGQDQFHVKYFGLQILKSIFETNRAFTQQAALRCPNSITAPLKFFKEQEVLRNDAILLLQCIVFESKVAQDVAVREGCLDLLFEIYQKEDPQINYAVIEDSLTLLRYVLQDNLDSQAIFCSSNKLKNVISSLEMKLGNLPPQMSVEESRILSSEISILFPFLASGTLPHELSAILQKSAGGQTSRLLYLLLNIVQYQGQIHDFSFSATAWDCLLEISLLPVCRQDVLGSKISIQGHPVPIQLGSLYITLTTPDCMHQMSAMRFCVHSLWKDEKMQDECLQQLLTSSNLSVLIFGETKSMIDILRRSRIFVSLAPLCAQSDNRAKIEGIRKGQMSLIKFCVDVLIKAILEHGKATESPEICLNCCVFLAAVTQASPVAVEEFLRSISERPFLVGVLLSESKFGENERMLKGICSFLIGIALNAPASSAVDSKVLKDTIENKIGLTKFFGHLNFILDQTIGSDEEFLFNGVIPKSLLKNLAEQVKAKFYPSSKETTEVPINGHVTEFHPKISRDISKASDELVDSSKEEMQNLRAENEQLKQRIEEERESKRALEEKLKYVEGDLQALSQAYSALDEHSNNLQRQLEESKQKPADEDLDSAMEDLLACLGQTEEKNARLVERLRSMGVTDIE
mmetsp:Transcript_8366/g.16760  ORF Transcript_8366/g.16760 Transcript_8366/m.16760 type:complete len:758 (-) Transcript_8366:67-2340(-)